MDRIKKLEGFLAKQPQDAFLMHALALEYIKINDLGAARNLFEKVLDLDPGYVGSYYHLGKLLETQGEREHAIRIYAVGMEACQDRGEQHAYRELLAAYEDLVY